MKVKHFLQKYEDSHLKLMFIYMLNEGKNIVFPVYTLLRRQLEDLPAQCFASAHIS